MPSFSNRLGRISPTIWFATGVTKFSVTARNKGAFNGSVVKRFARMATYFRGLGEVIFSPDEKYG